jgi:signal transduction histidine kinase/DNA-binding response OmpR family regulator/Tfp pilus assembly protein PilF
MISRIIAFLILTSFCHVTLVARERQVFPKADTTQIKADLDSAWKLARLSDSIVLPLIEKTLRQSRAIGFSSGEGNSIYTLATYYRNRGESETARTLYDSATAIFIRSGNREREAQCYLMIGSMYLAGGESLRSIDFFKKSIALNTSLNRKDKLADGLTNLGIAYENLGDYVEALECYLQCLKIDEEANYEFGIASDYGCLGNVYGKLGNTEKANDFLEKAIALSRKLGDEDFLASNLTNHGILLKNMKHYEKAFTLQHEALALFKKTGNARGIGTVYQNIGSIHQAKGEYTKALSVFDQSLKALPEGNIDGLITNYHAMAEIYLTLKQYPLALTYAKKAFGYATRIKMLENEVKITKLISDIYRAQKNYPQALEFHQLYITYKDSLSNTEKDRQIRDLQAKYETETKEKEITSLTQERELQKASLEAKNRTQYALLAGLIIIIAAAVIIFRNNRSKQEARRLLLDEQLKRQHLEAERFKELDHLKSRFFANIAHEFRTPLTLIQGPVENLLQETKNTTQKDQLLLVRNNASRLVKLVNQLLDLSKLEAGAVKFDYVSEDVIHFLKAHTYAFQSVADQKDIAIEFYADPSAFIMQFDRDKLEKIFSNILSNAFKFTPANGRVKVQASITEKILKVIIRDSGPGIPEDDLPYVFNRFYQSETVSRSTLGSGIGLELTKELVELCGGTIGVTNNMNGGAEFSFTLPAELTEVAVNNASHASNHVALAVDDLRASNTLTKENQSSENQELVLVIEDNDDVRDFIVSSMQTSYRVITAANGAIGIDMALELIPDLIITDVMMPVLGGLDVCKKLKDDVKTSHIPVIMLTAKADLESKIEGLQSGADDYLAKPFNTKELLTRIHNLITLRRKLQVKFSTEDFNSPQVTDEVPLKERLFISKLRETIEEHLAEEEYSVENLSRDMAMSRMQLHRKVKALTDKSTGMYMRSIRLLHGKQLLEAGLYTVSEVSFRVGFNSPTYFSTCFSEEFGFPPSELKSRST